MLDPSIKSTAFKGLNRDKILEMWEKKKFAEIAHTLSIEKWTISNEKQLQNLKKGDIAAIDETGIYKRAIKSRIEWLYICMCNIPEKDACALALKVLQKYF